MDHKTEVWKLVYEHMKKNINQTMFDLWFRDLTLDSISETTAVIRTKTMFNRNVLADSFYSKIEQIFEEVIGFKVKIEIVADNDPLGRPTEIVKEETPSEPVADIKKATVEDTESDEVSFFTGKDGYTFENFIVGNSNKLAHAACIAVANNRGYDYNPLFIHGPSGLGKTHLLHAIANHVKSKGQDVNIIYVTSEDFTNQLIQSISNKTTEKFRNKFRNADMLMIDDIQFIASRENTQEEIFHTFNALYEKGVQIILTSDRPARDINPLEDRLLTRFNWGITADINPPDFELRAAIIKSKASSKGVELSSDIVNMLAENLTSNIRQLEGAVKKLCAINLLSEKALTLEVAKEAISDIVRDKVSVNVTIDKILETVSRKYGVTPEDLKSKARTSNITNARQIAMYITKKMTDLSLPKIGNLFNRDHSTTLSSIKKIENEIKCNSLFEIDVNELIKEIGS